ncbi:hypothetical protein F4808DRAFT_31589 [Astrocystis sublimbata]|nr:hypothetical protein F4808DRAFT_31589 [Astrocystis sublimbata]
MSSARLSQATRLLTRQRRQVLAGSCLGLTVGTGVAVRFSAPRVRFDALSTPRSGFATTSALGGGKPNETAGGHLNPELMKQLSGGSVTGFLAGLLVSVFSKTLVLLLGASVVVVQIAARYGLNIVDQLRLKQRIGNSRVIAALEKDPLFKISFGLFFALSAFMRF